MQRKITKLVPTTIAMSALSSALLLTSTGAMAAGLTLNEQSASAMGTAYAGRSSSALDASTVFGNPAGMSRLNRMQVSGGLAFIDPRIKIKDGQVQDVVVNPNPAVNGGVTNNINSNGTNKGDMVPFTIIPFGYFVMPLDDQWHFGMGVYAPLGGKSDFEKTFTGRYQARKTEVTMITFQPTISYKFNEMLSVGIGPTISYLEGTLSSNSIAGVPGAPADFTPVDALYTAKGDDTAVGVNVGIMLQPYEDTTFGLTYRSHTKFKFSGDAKLENVAPQPIKGDAKLTFTAPESIDFSFTHKLDEQWTLYAGAVWTRWSRLDTIAIDDTLVVPGITNDGIDPVEEVNFRDTWAYSIGASYQLNPEWVLRAGFALDDAATSDANRSVRTPIGERKAVTIGAGWHATPDLTIDAAYGYLWESDAKVDQSRKPTGTRPGFSGTFQNEAHGISAQATYRF